VALLCRCWLLMETRGRLRSQASRRLGCGSHSGRLRSQRCKRSLFGRCSVMVRMRPGLRSGCDAYDRGSRLDDQLLEPAPSPRAPIRTICSMQLRRKRFDRADEVRTVEKARIELVELGELAVGRAVFQPGWRWSTHVKPIVGTESCQVHHLGYVVSGHLRVEMTDGASMEVMGGDAFEIPPARPRRSALPNRAKSWSPPPSASCSQAQDLCSLTEASSSCAARWSPQPGGAGSLGLG
jgi:hypothetical protein